MRNLLEAYKWCFLWFLVFFNRFRGNFLLTLWWGRKCLREPDGRGNKEQIDACLGSPPKSLENVNISMFGNHWVHQWKCPQINAEMFPLLIHVQLSGRVAHKKARRSRCHLACGSPHHYAALAPLKHLCFRCFVKDCSYRHLVISIKMVHRDIRFCSCQLLGVSTWKEGRFPEKIQDELALRVFLK